MSPPTAPTACDACDACLRRAWLLARLSGHLDIVRARVADLLALDDRDLVEAIGGGDRDQVQAELACPPAAEVREACAAAGLETICRCDRRYPAALRDLDAAPAVLFVYGGVDRLLALVDADTPAVAIVGARRASPYAMEMARGLARGAGGAQITVVSGMANGVDAAAHEGALEARGATVAILGAAPERAYPAGARSLHRRIVAGGGVVVAELGPGVAIRRWMFPARNRLIAALAGLTVVAAARRGSGAMLTADIAAGLDRAIGAVPGQATAPLSWGPHELLRHGAHVITSSDDLCAALGVDGASAVPGGPGGLGGVEPSLRPLLDALADGADPAAAFAGAGMDTAAGMTALAALELAGHIRRGPGGRFVAVA